MRSEVLLNYTTFTLISFLPKFHFSLNQYKSSFLMAGAYTRKIDFSGQTSGVYFCKLTTDSNNEIIKLTYLK